MFLIMKVNFIKVIVFSGKFMAIRHEVWSKDSCAADAEKVYGYPLLKQKQRNLCFWFKEVEMGCNSS